MARRNRACTRIERLVFINYSMTLHKIGVYWSYEASPDAMSVVKGLAAGRLLALKSGSNPDISCQVRCLLQPSIDCNRNQARGFDLFISRKVRYLSLSAPKRMIRGLGRSRR